ncbi:MAG: magnesium transporter CorA family protein [Methanocellales archaeon]
MEILRCGELNWINIEKPTQKEISFLAQNYHFHSLALDDCISKVQLPKIDKYENYLFIVLHFPNFSSEGRIIPSQLSIFLGKNYVITISSGDLKPLSEAFQVCKNDEKALLAVLRSPGYLLYHIIDRLVDSLFPLLDKIINELDDIEDKVFDEKIEAVREVTMLRRRIARFRRIIYPLKRVIGELAKETSHYTADDLPIYFGDVEDHVDKVWATLDECKEIIEIYKDTDFMLSTEKTNKILAILTIFFTLSIPITVIGTVYGMNIPLPGGIETQPWTFLGPYTTFIVLLILSTVPALLMLWYFRHSGWL